MKIHDVVHKQDVRPLIEIKSEPIMVGKWLFDTGAGISYMSSQHSGKFQLKAGLPN
jgi:hypothetical protein